MERNLKMHACRYSNIINTKKQIDKSFVPIALYNKEAIQDKRAKVVRSPKEAAIGVATLSGLMFIRRDNSMTATITRPSKKLATEAVTKALAHNKSPWWISKWASGIQPRATAAKDASKPTTIAWHWIKAKFPTINVDCCFFVSIWPKLAWVDNLEANVISRFPFKPNSAGTNMYTSDTTWYTGQC